MKDSIKYSDIEKAHGKTAKVKLIADLVNDETLKILEANGMTRESYAEIKLGEIEIEQAIFQICDLYKKAFPEKSFIMAMPKAIQTLMYAGGKYDVIEIKKIMKKVYLSLNDELRSFDKYEQERKAGGEYNDPT